MAQSTSADSNLTPINEHYIDDPHETTFCCSFFNFPCFKSAQSDDWERISTSITERESFDRSWWCRGVNGLKKVREWSELVAGPKWKTFIRRFNRTGGGGGGGGKIRPGKFQYDPLSYSLNFDEGQGQNGQFDDFSSRYASIPVQNGQ